MTVRKRILPSGWYPNNIKECDEEIEDFLRGYAPPQGEFVGGVVPHAGWAFSGRAAAKVMYTLSVRAAVDRIVLYGGHLRGSEKPIAYGEDAWQTPYGDHPLDGSLIHELASKGLLEVAGANFADNTVEIQMPLIAKFFPDIPVIAAHSPSSSAAINLGQDLAKELASKNLKAIYIGSADLTHYGPNYGFSPKGKGVEALRWVKEENDRAIIDSALEMAETDLLNEAQSRRNTCSAGPIASVIASCRELGANKGELIEYYTSHDVMPGDSFVGYAAIVY